MLTERQMDKNGAFTEIYKINEAKNQMFPNHVAKKKRRKS